MSAPKKDIADETWHVEEICNSWHIYREAGWNDKRKCVAEVHHYPSDEGLECANLMAAAPELLDALEGCCPLACGASYDECAVEGGLIVGGECNNIVSCPIWSAIQKASGLE